MTCSEINNGCLKLEELNVNLKKARDLKLGLFDDLSWWGIPPPKDNGKYVFPVCLDGSYEKCMVESK